MVDTRLGGAENDFFCTRKVPRDAYLTGRLNSFEFAGGFWPMDTLDALRKKMDEYSEKARAHGFEALVGPFQEYNERQRKKYDRLYIRTLDHFIKELHGKKNS